MNLEFKLLSRKFILAVLALLSTTLLVWFGHISDGVYSAVVIATVGAYIAGNVVQKSLDKVEGCVYIFFFVQPEETRFWY